VKSYWFLAIIAVLAEKYDDSRPSKKPVFVSVTGGYVENPKI